MIFIVKEPLAQLHVLPSFEEAPVVAPSVDTTTSACSMSVTFGSTSVSTPTSYTQQKQEGAVRSGPGRKKKQVTMTTRTQATNKTENNVSWSNMYMYACSDTVESQLSE